jgi:hypothetical protein
MEDRIISVLMEHFGGVYCDSCSSQTSGEYCDECNRKAMNWGISEEYAQKLANEILK